MAIFTANYLLGFAKDERYTSDVSGKKSKGQIGLYTSDVVNNMTSNALLGTLVKLS